MHKKTKLNNGLRVVYEHIPYIRSASFGIWVGTGSRFETRINSGISHFIEHMLFKGTDKRSAKEIAEEIDNIGGQMNAFTGKECTCYYTKVLDTDLDFSIEVLSDMLFNSKLAHKDIITERNVIYEEIGMYEDYPEDMVHDILSESVWENDALGYPILGTFDSLSKIDGEIIREYMQGNYTPENSVFAIVGNFEEAQMLELVEKYFGNWKSTGVKNQITQGAAFKSRIDIKEKDIEQTHFCLGFDSVEHGCDELYTLLAVNNVLGGGMSSRLFQNIREDKGLAYSIYSFTSSYKKAGLFSIYAAMNPNQLEQVMILINEEINHLLTHYLTDEELRKSKNQLKGNYILGLESSGTRMHGLGKSELLLGRTVTTDEVLDKIDSVDMDRVQSLIRKIFDRSKMSIAIVGKVDESLDIRKIFGMSTIS